MHRSTYQAAVLRSRRVSHELGGPGIRTSAGGRPDRADAVHLAPRLGSRPPTRPGRELFGSCDAGSGAKSTKKSERLGRLELFGRVGDVGGADRAKDATVVSSVATA